MNKKKTVIRIGVPEDKRVFRVYVSEITPGRGRRTLSLQVEDPSRQFEAEDIKSKIIQAMNSLSLRGRKKKVTMEKEPATGKKTQRKRKCGSKRWTKTEINQILVLASKKELDKSSIRKLAKEFNRTKSSIYQRINILKKTDPKIIIK